MMIGLSSINCVIVSPFFNSVMSGDTQWVPIGDQATQVSVLVYFELADVHDFYYDFAAGGGLSCSQQYSHC